MPDLRFVAALSLTVILCRTTHAESPVFEKDVLPVLKAKCLKCHSPKVRKVGLDLSSMASVRKGGESGSAIDADEIEESLIWAMVGGGDMPPEGSPPLTPKERDIIHRWLVGGTRSTSTTDQRMVTQHDVLPYLFTRCIVCHGGRRHEADLDLRSVASILKGGKSGPAVVAGKPEESLRLKRVLAKDMPPPRELIRAGVRPLESSEIDLITLWIVQGAKEYDVAPDAPSTEPDPLVSTEDRNFWSFQTPHKPAVPEADTSIVRNAIDAFLLRKLTERKLPFSPEADRTTLVRRVAIDLTGLPPEWNDVERFVADQSGDWYERMVSFYLDSPQYGERWGRYWLDLSGYADSEGKRSADPIRLHAWRFRDYVIQSLNADKPYDRFLLEQIAGDELYDFQNADAITPEMRDALIATGFLRMAPDGTGSDIVNTVAERFEVVADEIETLGSSVLGLTLKCAQCHSHKYDPIPQRDYYRLVAVFQGAYDLYDWLAPTSVPGQSKVKNPIRRYLTHVTPEERAAWIAAKRGIDDEIAFEKKRVTQREAELRKKVLDEELAKLPEEIREDTRVALSTDAAQLSAPQKYLAEKFRKRLAPDGKRLRKLFPELVELDKTTAAKIKQREAARPPEPMIRALWDRGEPSPTWVFRRGEFTNPGDLVGPGVPSALTDGQTPFQLAPQRPGSTGRRLALARWLTDPKHPLTARVLVNRVWFHHFGRGIVESLANFGRTGTPPTHPELLDWLAVSFVENGWSMKWLHRQIMASAAYRQSSQLTPELEATDPDNRWLSRMPMRRLEAEAVRDSLLAVAGRLDRTQFGTFDEVEVRADGLVTSVPGESGWRRTVYVRQRRKELPTILENFDLPQMIPNCVERPNSTVASQALHLLNNGMVRELSVEFAKRIEREVGDDRGRQLERVYEIALSRKPTDEEKKLSLVAIKQIAAEFAEARDSDAGSAQEITPRTQALASFCHVIMNSASFMFSD